MKLLNNINNWVQNGAYGNDKLWLGAAVGGAGAIASMIRNRKLKKKSRVSRAKEAINRAGALSVPSSRSKRKIRPTLKNRRPY